MRTLGERATLLGIATLALLAVAGGLTAWLLSQSGATTRQSVNRTYELVDEIHALLSALQDAESGQRGYIITGTESYLAPYRNAVERLPHLFATLAESTAGSVSQQARITQLHLLAEEKLSELAKTIDLRRSGDRPGAEDLVRTDEGKAVMDRIRVLIADMGAEEKGLLNQQLTAATTNTNRTIAAVLAVIVLSILTLLMASRVVQHARQREQRARSSAMSQAALLRTTIEALSQGIAVFDSEQRLLSWNHSFAGFLEAGAEKLATGITYAAVTELLSEPDTPSFLETAVEIAAQAASGRVQDVIVYERPRRDGRTFEIRRSPLSEGGFVITCTDYTDRTKTEAILRHAQRMEAVGHLTGGLAHDFNNLLQVVLANLDLIREKVADNAELKPIAGAAIRGAQRGATITRQLLAFARRQPLAPVVLDVNRLLGDMRGLLHRSLGEGIDLQIVESPGIWPTMTDPAQLESVVLNLALNARDAMPSGGRMTIETANTSLDEAYARQHTEVTPGQYVMLAVTDTGTGMPPEIAARAFEPFFTTKPEGKGTGLGLSQIFGFVKQSHGHVKIYTEEGHGTTVKIYLPRKAEAVTAPQIRTTPPQSVPLGSETILVVEDDEDVRATVLAQLGRLGYRAVAASTAAEALAVLHGEEKVDLLFTDVVLPGPMRGGQLAVEAKRLRPAIAILFTSGYTQNSIVHDGIIDDGALLLSKPYMTEILAAQVRNALDAAKSGAAA